MYIVAPLAGAWIETCYRTFCYTENLVAPLAGAWIETRDGECFNSKRPFVAPLAGAWIETLSCVRR